MLTATPGTCRGDWIFVSTIASRQFTAGTDASLAVLASTPGKLVKA